jgi:hypothetical protein
MTECGQCACCYEKHDQCAIDKAEAKEFAYFSGLTKGSQLQRKQIVDLLKEMQATALETETDTGKQTAWVLENALTLIKGETK